MAIRAEKFDPQRTGTMWTPAELYVSVVTEPDEPPNVVLRIVEDGVLADDYTLTMYDAAELARQLSQAAGDVVGDSMTWCCFPPNASCHRTVTR